MPAVAIVDGVKIQFYFDEYPPPHFHAIFAESVAQVQIDPPQILRGSLPPAKLTTVLHWASRNVAGLMDAWAAVEAGQKPKRL
ncbi:MAG: DUF4160 domain-containing protein [Beijerinckiaceae bacterium]|nr:DUF4160 domain-containing protein [Beijerinckiaceae bacterium]